MVSDGLAGFPALCDGWMMDLIFTIRARDDAINDPDRSFPNTVPDLSRLVFRDWETGGFSPL